MIYTSLAILAMSASAVVSPFSHLVHMHPHTAQVDNRINITLYNRSERFCDLTVAGRTYTVLSHQQLQVKAPAGTIVSAASSLPFLKKGDTVLELKPEMNHQTVSID